MAASLSVPKEESHGRQHRPFCRRPTGLRANDSNRRAEFSLARNLLIEAVSDAGAAVGRRQLMLPLATWRPIEQAAAAELTPAGAARASAHKYIPNHGSIRIMP
jgi:hypothetical protein